MISDFKKYTTFLYPLLDPQVKYKMEDKIKIYSTRSQHFSRIEKSLGQMKQTLAKVLARK